MGRAASSSCVLEDTHVSPCSHVLLAPWVGVLVVVEVLIGRVEGVKAAFMDSPLSSS